jgi:hypothetical protein
MIDHLTPWLAAPSFGRAGQMQAFISCALSHAEHEQWRIEAAVPVLPAYLR